MEAINSIQFCFSYSDLKIYIQILEMLDIVSHRVTIGRFNRMHNRQSKQSRSKQSNSPSIPLFPLLLILLSLTILIMWKFTFQLSLTAVSLLVLPSQQPAIFLPALFYSAKLHIPPQCPAPCHQLSLSNKAVHALNGNRGSKGIKLSHWNLGSASLQNKTAKLK